MAPHESHLPATLGHWANGLALGLLAVIATLAGLVDLLYAMIFASGYESVPTTTAERIPWLLVPLLAISAGGWALREAYRYPTSRWRSQRYVSMLLVAFLSALAWWGLATLLTQ